MMQKIMEFSVQPSCLSKLVGIGQVRVQSTLLLILFFILFFIF